MTSMLQSHLARYAVWVMLALAGPIFAQTAPPAKAGCIDCGVVRSVRHVETKGGASGVGAVAGGVLGGVIGHQFGSGRGNTAATIAGAGAGAYAGHQVEKSRNAKTVHEVIVTLEDGKTRTFSYGDSTAFKVGDRVKIVNGKLTRQ